MNNENWDNNHIQFPRLLAEIMATQDNLNIPALAESMDLTVEEINEIFDRAQADWEVIKETGEAPITVNLNIIDDEGNVVDGTTADMCLDEIADAVDCASEVVLRHRRGEDVTSAIEKLEESLSSAGVIE